MWMSEFLLQSFLMRTGLKAKSLPTLRPDVILGRILPQDDKVVDLVPVIVRSQRRRAR